MKYLDPKYTKSVQNSTVMKKHSFFLIDKFWHGHLKEDIKIANKHVKRCSKSFVIKELKMKTRHYTY